MCFLTIADKTGSIETVIFPKVFAKYQAILRPENCIAIKGQKSNRNGELSFLAEAVKELGAKKKPMPTAPEEVEEQETEAVQATTED